MIDFLCFLFSKTHRYRNGDIKIPNDIINISLEKCIADVNYHFPMVSSDEVVERIKSNKDELTIFLYRLGNELYLQSADESILDAINWLMRECCACEIYYSNHIDEGFYIEHGLGTVIGSRNRIGKGFLIYHNCTIGHMVGKPRGCVIGSNVILYAHSQILGEVTIGDNVVINNNLIVTQDIPSNVVYYGT